MILIISKGFSEHTTNIVIDWIDYKNYNFKRINGIDVYKSINVILDSNNTELNFNDIDWGKINCIWFRRWMSFNDREEIFLRNNYKSNDKNNLANNLNKFIREEYKAITKFFFDSIPKDICFDKVYDEEINKLSVLSKVIDFGIKIPRTTITTNTNKINVSEKFIVKPISNGSDMSFKNEIYLGYTSILNEELPYASKYIAPSLIQEKVNKKYEIRSFYMEGLFYSMAIFSQNDDKTKIDFRNYNIIKPNRNVPYIIPKHLQTKLKKVALWFGLNTCSFDLILSDTNEYYFLEVNPGGQFGMVSYPCNYYLEEKLATLLINTDKLNYEKQKNNT